ncbi:hypothetical protein LAZ67_1005891 [Cordylochernes scorpioides]|uniref:Fibronectin type-III domain-containing protein n=1 Tax=Cordylochernes scorpioides TaxID=51811 RepID=A0ABY6K387_9ARAC|nr:hypothetical protein LAZ67_1005891 [Cordylochernes scorpioides]
MERSLEQRYAIKFCVRLGRNATETFQMLQKAFKDDCISRSQSGKWHKAFKEGREEVADEPRSGRQTTARTDENVDRVLEFLRTDRRLSIQQIADTLHMSTFVVHGIVTEDLQMLTEDESWMFEYDPESKRQSCAWHTKSSPRPKKARMSKSRIKTMSIVFFDIRGIVHSHVAMIIMVGRSRLLLGLCINFVFNFSLRSFDSVDRLLVYMQPFCRPTDAFQNHFARYTLCILARSVSTPGSSGMAVQCRPPYRGNDHVAKATIYKYHLGLEPPENVIFSDYDSDRREQQSDDTNFEAGASSEIHFLTQGDLNDHTILVQLAMSHGERFHQDISSMEKRYQVSQVCLLTRQYCTMQPPPTALHHGTLRGYYVGYKERGEPGMFSYKSLSSSAGLRAEVAGLRRASPYVVVVQAFNDKGAGPWSDEVAVRTLQFVVCDVDPPVVQALSVTATTSASITLTWESAETEDSPISEPVKVDRITEDNDMQRMTEPEDEYVADALTNMQPHCEDRVSHLKDAMRGLAAPRIEKVIIAPIDISCATNISPHRLEQADKIHREILTLRRQPASTMSHGNHRKKDHQASSQPTPQDPFKTSIW